MCSSKSKSFGKIVRLPKGNIDLNIESIFFTAFVVTESTQRNKYTQISLITEAKAECLVSLSLSLNFCTNISQKADQFFRKKSLFETQKRVVIRGIAV